MAKIGPENQNGCVGAIYKNIFMSRQSTTKRLILSFYEKIAFEVKVQPIDETEIAQDFFTSKVI